MTQVEKRRLRVLKWRSRGWTWERIAKKVGLPDRRHAQMDAHRAVQHGITGVDTAQFV